jgi:hypothetical protein
MFRAGEVALPPRPTDKRPTFKFGAYDSDRDCTVAWIMGVRRPGGEAWLIHSNGSFLPFELTRSDVNVDGVRHRETSFFNFGGSAALALRTGVQGKTLHDSPDTRELQMLAIEGVLVAHKRIVTRYWGPPIFTALGREWRLTDFGYTEEPDDDDV